MSPTICFDISLNVALMRQLSIEPSFDEAYFKRASVEEISASVMESIKELIARRTDVMVKQAWPIIEQIYTTQGAAYENIAIPISDGVKIMQLVINLKKAYESKGMELYRAMAKSVTLVMIDEYWKEHLRDMDDLKQSVRQHRAVSSPIISSMRPRSVVSYSASDTGTSCAP